ncbi:hypothetical protein DOTSEDRAFT_73800 [Dothistroma septosporum NZE10]|uniref:Uncharacterized protein n=1 Tax=Dothistroma septosporum (strain NZE10 / CBS 128990) TaxID=675120 RepID=N1PH85_DOTSN|nr:hypothetical protein DOTSEDRAFT_73800 [Dothistroma septosporum NZE10]
MIRTSLFVEEAVTLPCWTLCNTSLNMEGSKRNLYKTLSGVYPQPWNNGTKPFDPSIPASDGDPKQSQALGWQEPLRRAV